MNYYYLVASLPSLRLEHPSDMSVSKFDALCAEWLPHKRMEQLQKGMSKIGGAPESAGSLPPAYAAYARFDRNLRIKIAKMRAKRLAETPLEKKPEQFPAADHDWSDHALNAAANAPNPFLREKQVDGIRWKMLDELVLGQEFSFADLCIYRLKLQIMNRYRRLDLETGRANFDAAAERISDAADSNGNQ